MHKLKNFGADRSQMCVMSFYPLSSPCAIGAYQAEHAFGRVGLLKDMTIPSCSCHNPGVHSDQDEYIKLWNKFAFIVLYRIDVLQEVIPSKDWNAEFTYVFTYFYEKLGEKKLMKSIHYMKEYYTTEIIKDYNFFKQFFSDGKKDKRKHSYDALQYPSSSTIAGVLGNGFDFNMLPEKVRNEATSRGTYIHAIAENFFDNKPEPIWELMELDSKSKPANIKLYRMGIMKMMAKYKGKVTPILQEERLFSELGYCGMPDMLWQVNATKEYELIDWKTFSGSLPNDNISEGKFTLVTKYWAQAASYLFMIEELKGITVLNAKLCCVDKTGKVKVLEKSRDELKPYFELFLMGKKHYNITINNE